MGIDADTELAARAELPPIEVGAHRGRPYVYVNSDRLARALAAAGAALAVVGAVLWLRSIWRLVDPAEPVRQGFDETWFQTLQAVVGLMGTAAMLVMATHLTRLALGLRPWRGRTRLAAVLAACLLSWTALVVGMSVLS